MANENIKRASERAAAAVGEKLKVILAVHLLLRLLAGLISSLSY
jgi:hypothetical protein